MLKEKKNKKILTIDTASSSLLNLKPKKFSDSKLIAKEIIKGNVIILELEEIKSVEAVRFVDFITGVLYTIGGSFERISEKTYILAPTKELLEKFSNSL